MAADVTKRKLADLEIADWKARYEAALLASGQIIYDWDPHSNEVTMGGALTEVLGYLPEDFMGTDQHWRTLIHPEDLDGYRKVMSQALDHKESFDLQYRVRRNDGVYRTMRELGRVVVDESGNIVRMVGFITDISEHRMLEQQLRQSQKMEAVGRLAGGVAHDFNNLLTIILGYSDLQKESTGPGHPLHEPTEQIHAAATRAASLTRQLLTFSRQQVLQPQIVNLNTITASSGAMLSRIIGEDIEVLSLLAEDLGYIEVDPSQMEQVLMNLVVNARDAMPNGGKLTIETANIELDQWYADQHPDVVPGPYVRLAVSDTGIGMDQETQIGRASCRERV